MEIVENDKSQYIDFFLLPEEVYECYLTAFPQSKDKKWKLDCSGNVDRYRKGLTDSSAMTGCVGEFCVAKYLNCKENKKVLENGDKGIDFKFIVDKAFGKKERKNIGDYVFVDVKTQYSNYKYEPVRMKKINLKIGEEFCFSKRTKYSDIYIFGLINKTISEVKGCLKRTIDEDDTWLNNWKLRIHGWITKRELEEYEDNEFESWVDQKTINFYAKKSDLKYLKLLKEKKNIYFPVQKED